MRKKQMINTMISIATISTMLVGGTTVFAAEADSEEQVTLTFWTPTWRKDAESQIIEDFMEQNPNITIEPTYYSTDDIKTNTKIAASSGTLPDMWYNWCGFNCADYYASEGLCYDLTEYAETNNWDEKFLSSALEMCKYEDGLYALPQVMTGLTVWYRTDIFEEYGLEIPTTFEELEAVCDTLVENGVAPFATGGTGGWHVLRYFEALLEYYAGAEEHDSLNALETDWASSEAVANTFTKLKEWSDKGYFNNGFLTDDPNNSKMYVFSGTCAMLLENSGMASDIVANEYDTNQYGWFAFPTGQNGETGRMDAYVKLVQFNKNLTDAQFDAAMKFWEYYYSDESLEAHPSIEQPTALKDAEVSESMSLADGMLEQIDASGSYMTTDLSVPNEILDGIYAAQDGVFLGEIQPEDAGAEVQKVIDSYKSGNE
ncbi:MAG: extracellular solute-binding protein [Eubacteriales bacterium]|nr:extracellular solute-binding protein [Eubacteriales bacterium]